MLDQYWAFTFADPVFYDSLARLDRTDAFAAVGRELPGGWRRTTRDVWVNVDPDELRLPDQGWKVHVSATVDNAEPVLDIVWDYCVGNGIPFKFLGTKRLVRIFNGKYMPREASGKFIAIYPATDDQLKSALDELGAKLDGEPGAYILSDLRWRQGPLYLRYGAFTERYCVTDKGDGALAISTPDGVLVPDERRPVFRPPPWAPIPEFVAAQHVARTTGGDDKLPYKVTGALHFSNSGGVYLAQRRSDGAEVVLKEARPHAGLDRNGRDAVARLRHEYEILRRLEGIEGVPCAQDYVVAGGHHFLVMTPVAGEVIWKWSAMFHPLIGAAPTQQAIADYTARALSLAGRLESLLEQIHDRGVVYGDLHPGNIMVTPDDSIALVDFEVAGEVDDPDYQPGLGASGFLHGQRNRRGVEVDRLALASVRLWLFLALDRVWELDPGKLAETVDAVERTFPLPKSLCNDLRRMLVPPTGTPVSLASKAAHGRPLEVDLGETEPDLTAACRSLVDAIMASATPDRADRLFPGDIHQFRQGGVGFAHGAAGVLWALSAAGFDHDPDHERWLLEAVGRWPRRQPGFYPGLHGIAHVLEELGHRENAMSILDEAMSLESAVSELSLYQGLSGIGLNLVHFANRTGDLGLLEQAVSIGERVRRIMTMPNGTGEPRRAGLMYGWSGVALLLLRLYEATGDEPWLDAAVTALIKDLDRAVIRTDGTLLLGAGDGRSLPYLASGTAGMGLVADQVLRYRDVRRVHDALPAILNVFQPEFVVESNLLEGRAGLIAAAARMSVGHPSAAIEQAISRHVNRMAWYALSFQGHLAFPGRRQFRLSMDLATGNAGVLLAFTAVRNRMFDFLPFLRQRVEARSLVPG